MKSPWPGKLGSTSRDSPPSGQYLPFEICPIADIHCMHEAVGNHVIESIESSRRCPRLSNTEKSISWFWKSMKAFQIPVAAGISQSFTMMTDGVPSSSVKKGALIAAISHLIPTISRYGRPKRWPNLTISRRPPDVRWCGNSHQFKIVAASCYGKRSTVGPAADRQFNHGIRTYCQP